MKLKILFSFQKIERFSRFLFYGIKTKKKIRLKLNSSKNILILGGKDFLNCLFKQGFKICFPIFLKKVIRPMSK